MKPTLLMIGLVPSLLAGGLQGRVSLVDKKGTTRRPLADLVVLLEPVDGGPRSGPKPTLEIRTVGKRFVPRVSLTTPNSDVVFPNLDHILHNVFSVTPGNTFDTGHYQPGDRPKVRVRQPGLVKLYCNVHQTMNAFLWVVETPWATLAEADGSFAFQNVPPGSYRLRLRHPESVEQSWPLTLGPGLTTGSWSLDVSRPAFEPHKNKFGKDYPPEKDNRNY